MAPETLSGLPRRRLSDRDLRALAFIGEGYEVAQYQLQAAIFPSLSPTVASRLVRRAADRGLLIVERVNGFGMNRLRLTARGREALALAGCEARRLFSPRRPVAPKDWAHTLRINDLRVVLAARSRPPAELLPAWALQRELIGEVVPDLLAVWREQKKVNLLLACEIDRGTESLRTIFLPKLRRLADSLRDSADDRGTILVLTEGQRRTALLLQAARDFDRLLVERLPEHFGSAGLTALRARLEL